jgi:hypothetical protein
MTTINDKFSQPAGFDKVGPHKFVEGPKFEMPSKQEGTMQQPSQSPSEKQVFEDGLKRLGLYDLVRHLNYPVV